MKSNYKWLYDWTFAGKMNSWFVLLSDNDVSQIQDKTLNRIESIVEKYKKITVKILKNSITNKNYIMKELNKIYVKSILESALYFQKQGILTLELWNIYSRIIEKRLKK